MIRAADEWLRLNQAGHFTSGTYTPYLLRADGGFQVDGTTVIGGDAWVEGDRIRQNTIDDSEIQDNSLTAVSLAANSVGNSELVDDITVNYVRGLNYIYGDYGTIARSTDEWLRLNDGSTHTNGVYIPNLLRADGGLRVGDDEGFYRSAEDVVRTGDSLIVDGSLTVSGSVNFGVDNVCYTKKTGRMQDPTRVTVSIDCNSGDTATGGGCDCDEDGSPDEVMIRMSHPLVNAYGTPDGWLCVCERQDGSGTAYGWAYVVCCF